MNVFEDLVTELQEENLLEETVIGERRTAIDDSFEIEVTEMPNRNFEPSPATEVEIETAGDFAAGSAAASPVKQYPQQNKRLENNKEFFKKRAMTEVSSLQIVEHVLTGVEREYLKMLPHTFDDFRVKKALNNFLQVPDSVNTEEHARAEFELLHQTEAWCTALASRDKKVPVSALRQFCENTKPALSSQAMLATGRFYRNLPYSENVRSKFDFVMTRLFSRPNEAEQRVALFNREETLNHIKTLYADWASVPLYATNDDDSDVVMAALSFEDLAVESENAASFDQLIKSDFFGRLRIFKESISELFFAPSVTAAAIDANVRIGNSYVKLIGREREKMDPESIRSKFDDLDGSMVSDAIARTLDLVDILKIPSAPVEEPVVEEKPKAEAMPRPERVPAVEKVVEPKVKKSPRRLVESIKEQIRGFSRSVLVLCAVLLVGTAGLVVWSSYFSKPTVSNSGVVAVDFSNPSVGEHVEKPRVSNDMLYAQVKESWATLPKEKKLELLKLIYEAGATRGYTQVNLIDKSGRTAGFASPNRLDIPTL